MISFIIPAKNEKNYIGTCLASILMQETNESYEIIVVDNVSTDDTVKFVKDNYPDIKIIEQFKIGTSAARQKGTQEARGEILIFLDADVRLPDKSWLMRALEKINKPDVVALSSHYRYYGVNFFQNILQAFGTFILVYPWIFLTNNIFRYSTHMVGGMMVMKKTALLKVGGFDTSTEFFGDEALIVKKLYPLGRICVSPKLWVWTSGRRYKKQGMLKTVFYYVFNYFWVQFTGRPYHRGG